MSPEEFTFKLNAKELKDLDPEITLRRIGDKYAVEKNGESFTVFALTYEELTGFIYGFKACAGMKKNLP